MLEAHPELYTPPVRQRLEMGRYVMGEDYARASVGARVLTREVDAALDGVDALVLPTVPIVAPPLGSDVARRSAAQKHPVRALMLRLTQLFDVTGHPAITIPCGRSAERPAGRPATGRPPRPDGGIARARRGGGEGTGDQPLTGRAEARCNESD